MSHATDKLREELDNTPATMVILPNKLKGERTTIVRIPLERLRALIESNSKELLDRVERDVIGEDKEKQHVRVRKNTHGSCCQCQTCGEDFDDCILNNTLDEDELRAEQRTKLNQLRKQEGLK